MANDPVVRLRPVDLPGDALLALPWYADPVVLEGSEGPNTEPFSLERVTGMYRYLASIGEVFIIEVLAHGDWIPVGDAALSDRMMPIVIGDKRWRGCGVGRSALRAVIGRAREKGYRKLIAHQIYRTNLASERLFAGAGFHRVDEGRDREGSAYGVWELILE